MGTSNAAIIFWVGAYGGGDKKTKQMRFPFLAGSVPGTTAITVMRNVLRAYTDAEDTAFERILKSTYEPTPPGASANLDVKARIAFKDASDGKVYRVELPAPKDSMFEVQGEGDRVKAADLTTIVAAISTAYSRTFIPLWGKKIQRS